MSDHPGPWPAPPRAASQRIAARRLADNPQPAFRAISGLVLAVFVGTGGVATISSGSSATGGPGDRASQPDPDAGAHLAGGEPVQQPRPSHACWTITAGWPALR